MKSAVVVLARLTLILGVLVSPWANAGQEVVVYSARSEGLIKPIFDLYTQQTGVKVVLLNDEAGPLIARLAAEGSRTPADMLMTVDAGNLWYAADQGLLRPIKSRVLEAVVPDQYQDEDNRWFGLSLRARTIVYSKARVQPQQLSTYQDLADPKWKGKLCLRTAKKVYNQSMLAMLMERQGEQATEQMVKGWVSNLAAPVFANDTALIEAIVAGQCDVGIVNTYYFGRLQMANPEIPAALFWPNQSTTGVHVNISGAGVTTHAKSPKAAQALLEWLAKRSAQEAFAGINMEYPVNDATRLDPIVESWGEFKADPLNLEAAGRRQKDAIMLMDRAGYR
ncbi:extracellular solute-binding protein [Ketobacter alkanivorans]|uniref:Fe(3+) ABC transporter substrate-binding protein n=1 Tax=Ketobacter alkanivorans TaxID=1917421 RepID=A0A2K9LLX3_9GAMM|nr:extracellular solute-binding protein [Ketobacter alkanivorans]AUM12485.1 Fe(3+) ABC transporter substrate-binding protein [Ketobacter alkanivorans]MCP5015434.1 extracellular solute-binding protein [Ketobacter sp.]